MTNKGDFHTTTVLLPPTEQDLNFAKSEIKCNFKTDHVRPHTQIPALGA